MNSPVDESQSNGRVENAVQRVQNLIRTLKDALEKRLNTRVMSSDPIFPWIVEWSAGLITRYVKRQSGRTAYREARGHDAQAPVAEFGKKINVHDVEENEHQWAESRCEVPRRNMVGAENDKSIIGTPNGVIKAKTVRRLPESKVAHGRSVVHTRNTIQTRPKYWEGPHPN